MRSNKMRKILTLSLVLISLNCFAETTFYSDGTIANTFGDTTFFSDGTTATKFGDTTFYSDGTIATTYP